MSVNAHNKHYQVKSSHKAGFYWWWPCEDRLPVDHTASSSSVIDQMWSVIPAAIAGVERRV
jgi:hypothetical protein